MELDARKMQILQAIIDDYILTATPVGSRTISRRGQIGLSSATIRNEMSDLEELGYLEQPHTSAGRVPSDKAYRLYVDSIMRHAKLTDAEMDTIKRHYSKRLDEVDDVIRQTAQVLANLTKYASMVLAPKLHAARLRNMHLVPIGEGKALVIIVTDAGITRDAVIRMPKGMSDEQLEWLSKQLTSRFTNRRLDEVGLRGLAEFSDAVNENRLFLDSVTQSIMRSMAPDPSQVELSGTANILSYPEYNDLDRARSLLSAIEDRDMLYGMLTGSTNLEFKVTIGSENAIEGIKDCSVVTATYRIGDMPMGSFGVIGPTRMDYPHVLAIMRSIGRSLSETLTNMFEEDR